MDLGGVLTALPRVEFAFAYGSGVFQQVGYAPLTASPATAAATAAAAAAPAAASLPLPPSPLSDGGRPGGAEGGVAEGKAAEAPPMVDFVVAVADPAAWHEENMALNPCHYAGIGRLGSSVAALVQEAYGAGVYYNTMVPLPAAARGAPGQLMKYGVISLHALVDDLLHWRSMYISGRMHKPVRAARGGV